MTKITLRKTFFAALLLFSTSAFAHTAVEDPIVKLLNFKIPQLGRERTIRIYLPAGYYQSNKKYPVIYMTDGQNIFKSDADIKDTWAVDSTLRSLPAEKQCIVVGIDHAGKDRITEYNPYNSTYGKGDGLAYTHFIVETLKPYIDKNYRTKKDAKYTAIAGSSMGSLLAMYAATEYPDSFGNAGIFSPAFWIGEQIYTDVQLVPTNKRSGYYLTCGDVESKDMLADTKKMDSLLHVKSYTLKQVPGTKVNVGAKHNEKQWREAFPAFYQWVSERFGL